LLFCFSKRKKIVLLRGDYPIGVPRLLTPIALSRELPRLDPERWSLLLTITF
jgi:hypothetical protein